MNKNRISHVKKYLRKAYIFSILCSPLALFSAFTNSHFKPAETDVPLPPPVTHYAKCLQELFQQFDQTKEDGTIDPVSKDLLLDDIAAYYAKGQIQQREYRIECFMHNTFPRAATVLINAFLFGGFSAERIDGTRSYNLPLGFYDMLIHFLPQSMPLGWKACSFGQSTDHAYYIVPGTRVLQLVNLRTDERISSCHIPANLGDIQNITGSLPGIASVSCKHGICYWNGSQIVTYSHSEKDRFKKLALLPDSTIVLGVNSNGIIEASFKKRNIIKSTPLGTNRNSLVHYSNAHDQVVISYPATKQAITFNPHVGKKTFDLSEAPGQFKVYSAYPYADLMLVSQNWVYFVRENTNIFFVKTQRRLREVVLNDTTTLCAVLYEQGHAVIATPSQKPRGGAFVPEPKNELGLPDGDRIEIPSLRGGIDRVLLRGSRLLFTFKNENLPAATIDLRKLLALQNLNLAQADLCTSLVGAVQLLQEDKRRPQKERCFKFPKKLFLDKNQTEIWESIPGSFRTCFTKNNAHLLRLRLWNKNRSI